MNAIRAFIHVTPYVGVWIETIKEENQFVEPVVTPYVGVWIETIFIHTSRSRARVTPYVGVWIETMRYDPDSLESGSHPTWVCGLKRHDIYYICFFLAVTPYVGVWIETPTCDCFQNHSQVTPYVGVWIETSSTMLCTQGIGCHTLRGCVD